MPVYKVVLQVTSDQDEASLRAALERVGGASPADGGKFQVEVLALAETEASRMQREDPSGAG